MSRGVMFACGCGRPLRGDYVEAVIPGGVVHLQASVVVSFRCECTPGRELTRRYYAASGAIDAVTGGQGLPFRNPCPLVPVPNDHPDMQAWRYLLNRYAHDVDAFLAELPSSS